jgi:CrcB protein
MHSTLASYGGDRGYTGVRIREISLFALQSAESEIELGSQESSLNYLLIAIGGALGSMARHWCGVTAYWLWPVAFPWGTLSINIIGSFVIGAAASLTASTGRFPLSPEWQQFIMVGICGGYTTFSSFSLQTMALMRDGRILEAGLYIGLSVFLCVAGVALGQVLASAIH